MDVWVLLNKMLFNFVYSILTKHKEAKVAGGKMDEPSNHLCNE